MLKTLLKKQLAEINQSFFYDKKKGKKRSKTVSVIFVILYALLLIFVIGGMFTYLALTMCRPMVDAGLDWMYFAIIGMIAIAFGIFGSVFNTYSGLYLAKDNDMLLSMPIPVKYLLVSRLLSVYLMGLMFSAVVILPATVVYFITAGQTVLSVIGNLILVIMISLIVLVLSCALGYLVARISQKLKNRSFITVLLSLAFLAIYYFVYFKANELIAGLLQNLESVGKAIKGSAYPVYMFGSVGTGNILSILILTAVTLLALVLVWYLLSRSFISIATSVSKTERVKYRSKKSRMKSVSSALLAKEAARFTHSPTYMLNCGFGTVFIIAAAVYFAIQGNSIFSLFLNELEFERNEIVIIFIAMICVLSSMNDITAPSVSLEGKSIYILQSLPIDPVKPLRAKVEFHLLLTSIPVAICSVVGIVIIKPSVVMGIFLLLLPQLFVLMSALVGLFVNLKKPNLEWTSEMIPIKQSMGVMIVLLGGMFYGVVFVIAGFYVSGLGYPVLYTAGFTALTAAASFALAMWIRKKGTRIFSTL